jgi:hypothetical protein
LFFSHQVVNNRKENPTDKKDLLNLMLSGKDPKTGEGMTDQSIVDNVRLAQLSPSFDESDVGSFARLSSSLSLSLVISMFFLNFFSTNNDHYKVTRLLQVLSHKRLNLHSN